MPGWVEQGVAEYQKRMQHDVTLHVVEIPTAKRGKTSSVTRLMELEGKALLAAVPKGAKLIALDVLGKTISTPDLAAMLNDWRMNGSDIAIAIGGPDGLSPQVLAASEGKMSLSALTLPHPLVRVLLTEQLYRAWTITEGHPYHR